jgi:hypothetical protein
MSKHAHKGRRRTKGSALEEGMREPSATDVARFIADMTLQMQTMAQAAKLDLLAYLLSMSHEEANAICRGAVK